MSFDILKEETKNNKIRNLYLFYGPEEYLKKFYAEAIENSLLAGDLKTLNKVVLEGKTETGRIIDNCETLPIFSEKKVVIVKNSGLFKTKKKTGGDDKKAKPQNDELTDFLQDIPAHTCLIFYESEADKRLKLVDTVKKHGLVVEFVHLKPDELVRWVMKKFKAAGKEIDVITASRMVESCEQGMTDINNEIIKLTAYLEEKTRVTAEDIDRVCSKSVKSRIFDLTDAIAERNGTKAFILLKEMIILKEPVPRILFMIARQFRQILQVKLLSSEGARTNDIAARMGLTPYIAGKILKQAGSFQVDKLKKAVGICLELDIAMKTGKLEDITAVELLIAEFSK